MQTSNLVREVFISFTEQGKKNALELCDLLNNIQSPKFKAWVWTDGISAGNNIKDTYTDQLQISDLFIPIITSDYKDKDGTKDELRLARIRENHLKELYGGNYVFIVPYIGENNIDVLNELGLINVLASRTLSELVKGLCSLEQKLPLTNNPFSFANWPEPFIGGSGDIDALIVVGHTGKEDRPTQEEIGEIGRFIYVEKSEDHVHSMTTIEYIPELLNFLNRQSLNSQINIGRSINHLDLRLIPIYSDWHLLKHYYQLIRSSNLICLGAGDSNLITQWVMSYYEPYLPVRFDTPTGSHVLISKGKGEFEDTHYRQVRAGNDYAVSLGILLPNPLNPKKVVLIAAGLTGVGTQAAMLALSDPMSKIRNETGYSPYIRIIKAIENKWRATGYEILR